MIYTNLYIYFLGLFSQTNIIQAIIRKNPRVTKADSTISNSIGLTVDESLLRQFPTDFGSHC